MPTAGDRHCVVGVLAPVRRLFIARLRPTPSFPFLGKPGARTPAGTQELLKTAVFSLILAQGMDEGGLIKRWHITKSPCRWPVSNCRLDCGPKIIDCFAHLNSLFVLRFITHIGRWALLLSDGLSLKWLWLLERIGSEWIYWPDHLNINTVGIFEGPRGCPPRSPLYRKTCYSVKSTLQNNRLFCKLR
jgi:hypothetical protein